MSQAATPSQFTYASVEDFCDHFGVREVNMIADRDADGVFEHPVVFKALVTATMQIDGAVAQRCTLPLSDSTPDHVRQMLKQWCVDIARYRLSGFGGVVVTEDIEQRYREAKKDLDMVVAGKLFVCGQGGTGAGAGAGGNGGLNPEDTTAGAAESCHDCRLFTRSKLRDWRGGL